MRVVAGSILIHAAVVLVATVLLSSRLTAHSGPDAGFVNFVLIAGGLAIGLVGFGVLVNGLARDRQPSAPPPTRPAG